MKLQLRAGSPGAREYGRVTIPVATYRVRRASDADLPAVLEVLAQNQAVAPTPPPFAPGAPSGRQRSTWERVTGTTDLTVYLAVHVIQDGDRGQEREQPVGTAAISHKRHADDGAHQLYRSLGFTAEAEGFRRYLERGPDA